MRFLASLGLSVLAFSTAWADEIPGTKIAHGNWSGAGYTFDDGTFSHCSVAATYNHGNTLLFSVNSDATVSVGVVSPSEIFSLDQQFPVALYVDRRAPFFGSAMAIDTDFAVLSIADIERALDSFRRGRTLVIQSQFGEVPFDLTGTSRALAMVFDCAVQNLNYRAPSAAVASNQVDPALLMQVATGNITALGVSDFVFLTASEISDLFPNANAAAQHVFWRSPSMGLLSGVIVGNRAEGLGLNAGDAQDLAMLASLCGGDFVTGVRQLPEASVEMREIRAACTEGSISSEHYLTKFQLGDRVVYSWLWFEGEQVPSEAAPERRKMSESAALQTASFLSE